MQQKKYNYINIWVLCSALFWAMLYSWSIGDDFVFLAGIFPMLQLGFLLGFILKFKPKYRWIYWSVFSLLILVILAELAFLWYFLKLAQGIHNYPH